jgi:shikimate dehydrogenase
VTADTGATAPDQYGLIGHPVDHSWSPFIHGMFAQQTSQNMAYRLYDIAPADLEAQVNQLFTTGVRGLNVTVPHKEAVLGFTRELTPRAARAGAVNTLILRSDGTLLGDNTDGAGLVNDLRQNQQVVLRDARILVLGAGGAARGVVGPLLDQLVRELTIANRTAARAQALCDDFQDKTRLTACGFDAIPGRAFDVIINATAASLHGVMPVLPNGLVSTYSVCYDMAYGRGDTPFTEWATQQRARLVCKGWGMLVEQAAVAFQLWRGIRPDTWPVMRALAQYQ